MTLPLRDLGSYLAARLLPALATMCLTFLCIHALAPEEYAAYSITLLSAGVAAGFVGGVSGQAMLRYAHELTPAALQRGLLGVPLLAAALACPLVLLYLQQTTGLSATAWLATLSIPALALMDTRRSLFVARARARAVLALDATRAGLALLLGFVLLQAWAAQSTAPMLAQLVAVLAGLLLVGTRHAGTAPAAGTRTIDARYLAYGLGLAGWTAVIVAMSVAERAVVGEYAGLAASGRYAAQADLVNAVFAAAGGALGSALMPAYLAQTHTPDAAALRRLRGQALGAMGATAALCLLLGAGLAWAGLGRVSQAIAGDLATAVTLVAAGLVWAAAGFVQKPLELRGQTLRICGCVLLALLLLLVLAPLLADRLGPAGVALAKLCAGLAYCALVLALLRRPR